MRQGKSWIMTRNSTRWLLAAFLIVGEGQQAARADSPTVAPAAAINHVGRTATVSQGDTHPVDVHWGIGGWS